MLINNASVPWLSGRGAEAALVGAFSGALTLSRIPIQLGGAAFGPLLRRFAHAIEIEDASRERADFRGAVTGAVGVALAFALGFSLLAPPFISLYLGSAYDVPRWVCALLAVSSGAMLVAVVAQVRAAAQERWRAISYSWLLAAGAFVCTLVVPGDLLLRCSLAPATASLTGLAALLLFGRRAPNGQPTAAR
jgi:O-antigen/teichoic acid export membrane protein